MMSGCPISTVSAHCRCFLNPLEGCVAAGLLPSSDRLRLPTCSRGSPSWDSHENSCPCVEVELNSVIGCRAILGCATRGGNSSIYLPVLPWGRRVSSLCLSGATFSSASLGERSLSCNTSMTSMTYFTFTVLAIQQSGYQYRSSPLFEVTHLTHCPSAFGAQLPHGSRFKSVYACLRGGYPSSHTRDVIRYQSALNVLKVASSIGGIRSVRRMRTSPHIRQTFDAQ